jgi:hypothetical protein
MSRPESFKKVTRVSDDASSLWSTCMVSTFFLRAFCTSAALWMLGASADLLAEPVRISPGFIDGGTYRSSSLDVRNGYVSGMVDGLSLGIAINHGGVGSWISPCVGSGTTIDQVRATVDGFVGAHPETAKQPMNTIFYRAMMASCALKGFATGGSKPQG